MNRATQRIRVLVADDHPVFRRGMRAILGAEPDTELVGEATDGEEAVRLALELRPDVLLMDLNMPKGTGIEATRRILVPGNRPRPRGRTGNKRRFFEKLTAVNACWLRVIGWPILRSSPFGRLVRLYIMLVGSDSRSSFTTVPHQEDRRDMHTRHVHADELDLFVETAGAPNHRSEVEQYLESMFATGSMRPEWCFVAEEEQGEGPLGRVAFWTLPGMEEPFALVLLDVPWDGDYMGVGMRLLGDVLGKARALGAREIEHVVDDPPMRPQFQHHPERRIELLTSVGFTFRRETGRFEWRGGEPPVVSGRLTFRSVEEAGEDALVEAMRMVSEGTLDREIQGERERLGAQEAAREFFDDAQRVEHDPSWWRLAYTPAEHLVGLVMPAEPPGFLTIFYVGVVPEMRGQGYVDDLLATGTATLLEVRRRGGNEKPLRVDTDVANGPMAAAFERAGWTRFAGRREYVIGG